MNYLYDLWDDVISLLLPRLCHGCGNQLLRNEKVICTECYVVIPRTNFHLIRENPVEKLFWGRCLVERAAAFSYYTRDSRIRRMIHHLKYKGAAEIGTELGRIYGNSLKDSDFLHGIDFIIPVPLHPSKKRQRGYNQSDLISMGISDATGIPVDTGILKRTTVTGTQTRKSRYDRWTNVDDIFRVTGRQRLEGKHVLIVDDVITTGSTIEACADEILREGNTKVSVAALAFSAI
ncbi:MAG: ComF family protein [Bacteroidales bacterium]